MSVPNNRVFHDVDTKVVASLLMQQVEYALCLECCRIYTDVETAECGHSLCSNCWLSQGMCSMCMVHASQTQRRRNIPLQTFATHSQVLFNSFKKLFHIAVDECWNTVSNDRDEKDNTTVENWLRNPQNKFNSSSKPQSEIVDLHFEGLIRPAQKKNEQTSSNMDVIIYQPQPQTDWDKIETMPNSQVVHNNKNQHCIDITDSVYTCENPRRSSRNKNSQTGVESLTLNEQDDRSSKSNKKELAKRNWNNLKKMRKEFSKLNKIQRNKLNVSIENVKRAKITTKPTVKDSFENLPHTPHVIDEESPLIVTHEQKSVEEVQGEVIHVLDNTGIVKKNMSRPISRESTNVNSDKNDTFSNSPSKDRNSNSHSGQKIMSNKETTTYNKILFYKRGKLCYDFCKEHTLKQMRCAACQTSASDDIFITIKIGSTLTNVVINEKKDVQVKTHSYNQNENEKDEIMKNLSMTQHEKDKYVDSRQMVVELPSKQQDLCHLSKKISLPNEILGEHPKNHSTQREIVDAQKSSVIVENVEKVASTANIDQEESDIFNNTPTVHDHTQFPKNPSPSEVLMSVGEKRVHPTDASIPFPKRVCLSDSVLRPSPLSGQPTVDAVPQPNSENVFSLSERLCCSPAQEPPISASANVDNLEDHVDKSDDDLLIVGSLSGRSIVEESQHPEAVPVAINTFSTNNINDLVNKTKGSTDNYPVWNSDTNDHRHRDKMAVESLPNNELPLKAQTLETPLSMTNFLHSIEHNSTPLARKSLKFDHVTLEPVSIDATLCLTTINRPNTQEREYMSNESVLQQPTPAPSISLPCVAGSNLRNNELVQLKLLCMKLHWTFLENYSPTLTHLVTTVDDENKAQRTVKYMCALAAGKWVVSFAWAEGCAAAGRKVPEEPFEVLDPTGAPGPRRSRTAKRELFAGFTFHCMPPFTLLDLPTLEGMLKANGACVVESLAAARADGREPHIVLAESDQSHTPENRFTFMAMESCVVPVSVDWVLISLGAYELCPLRDSLLCPVPLVTKHARHWLTPLLDKSTDSDLADSPSP